MAAAADGPPPSPPVAELDARSLSYADFHANHLVKGLPALIRGAALSWRCASEWRGEHALLDCAALTAAHGQCNVTVHMDSTLSGGSEYGAGDVANMPLAAFLRYLETRRKGGESHDESDAAAVCAGGTHYLKDWHLAALQEARGEDKRATFYDVPVFFQHDLLNGHQLASWRALGAPEDADDLARSDYRFVYLGPAGSATPLHRDVLCSHSWSANVFGVKRWRIYSPAQVPWLRGRPGTAAARELPRTADDALVPSAAFPNAHLVRPTVVEQRAGDALFVPAGFVHDVLNETECLSVNHNAFHAHGLAAAWRLCLWPGFLEAHRNAREDVVAAPGMSPSAVAAEALAVAERNAAEVSGLALAAFAGLVARARAELAREAAGGDVAGSVVYPFGHDCANDDGARARAASEVAACDECMASMRADVNAFVAEHPEAQDACAFVAALCEL